MNWNWLIRLRQLIFCIFSCFRRKHESHHFAPGEIVFQVQHPMQSEDETRANMVQAIQSFLSSHQAYMESENYQYKPRLQEGWHHMILPPKEDVLIITFPADPDDGSAIPFSLVPLNLVSMDERDLLLILHDAALELRNGPINLLEEKGISLVSLSPNWLASDLHHGGATGGPGSWPYEVPAPTGTGHEFTFDTDSVRSLSAHKARLSGGEIHVAILDTTPAGQEISQGITVESVLQTLGATPPDNLIRYLFGGGLDIQPASNQTATSLAGLRVLTPPPDHYPIPDHGTFITGLIHSIAPNAILHLHQVLNDYGLGTLTSISEGLRDAVTNYGKEPLVINCSFMIDDNLPDHPTLPDLVDVLRDPVTRQVLTQSMRAVFRWAANRRNVLIVAAAGNDATATDRPYARFPAAFQSVLGVGALPQDYIRDASGNYIHASYSNFSYSIAESKVPGDGLMIFGGELDQPYSAINHIANRGVLGVYLGQFPQQDSSGRVANMIPSTNRWASWAGTSFSAPLITAWLAGTLPVATTPPARTFQTPEGEKVIIVRQG